RNKAFRRKPMFHFWSVKKQKEPPSRCSVRPQLETLEGRTVPSTVSDFVPVSEDLTPQAIVQGPANDQTHFTPVSQDLTPQAFIQSPANEQIQFQEVFIAKDAGTLKTLGFEKPREQYMSELRHKLEGLTLTVRQQGVLHAQMHLLSAEQVLHDSQSWDP